MTTDATAAERAAHTGQTIAHWLGAMAASLS